MTSGGLSVQSLSGEEHGEEHTGAWRWAILLLSVGSFEVLELRLMLYQGHSGNPCSRTRRGSRPGSMVLC